MITREEYLNLMDEDATLQIGDRVRVRWGWGQGFRAEGYGTITALFAKSLRVKLEDDVKTDRGAIGWPAGFELKGIQRFSLMSANMWDGVVRADA